MTASMWVPRIAHELTRLNDGTVLVTGGWNGLSENSVERYDPSTGLFTFAPFMSTGRTSHTATLLLDGRVLVVGGITGAPSVNTNTTEIFDPATNTWSAGPPTIAPHAAHTATRLSDGRVVVVGGYLIQPSGPLQGTTAVEVFDPATQSWAMLATLPEGRYRHRTVTLPNGNLFVVGGLLYDGNFGVSYALEISPSGLITQRGAASAYRWRHLAFTLPDGKVLVTGGLYNGFSTGPAPSQLYDPATQTFSLTTNQPPNHVDGVGAVLADSKVVVASAPDVTISLYTASTGLWSTDGYPAGLHVFPSAALLANGRLLIAGGTTYGGTTSSRDAELYISPVCTPLTCGAQSCGSSGDTCGGTLECGSCSGGQVCTANVCCMPTTCAAQGKNCGTITDGCGSSLNCGTCSGSQVCSANTCCNPISCASQGATCGSLADGCGNTLNCGTCGVNASCVANACVACTPVTCSQIGSSCGWASDGCGGTISCGTCSGSNLCLMGGCVPGDLIATYDAVIRTPRCGLGRSCDSGALLVGRANVGPELNAPNTIANSCAEGTGGVFHADESLDGLKITTVNGGVLASGTSVRIDATVWAYAGYASDRLDLYYTADTSNPTWTLIATRTPTNAGLGVLSVTFTLPSPGPAGLRQAIRGRFRYAGVETPCATGAYIDTDDLVFDVLGQIPVPTITIGSPQAGSTLHGPQTMLVTASDPNGVTAVQYYVGSTYLGANAAPFVNPLFFDWNSAQVPDGPAQVIARAFNRAGLFTTSAPVPVTIDNTPPVVALTAPADGALLRGNVSVTASASDATGITSVAFLLDGVVINTDMTAPFEFSWASTSTSDGAHTLQARAIDSATLVTLTPPVNVVVDNAAPSVAISSPGELAVVHGSIAVTATVSDLSTISQVEFFDGASSLGLLTSAPWTITWNALFAGEGAHQLSAVALDAAGNSATSALRNVQVSNAPSIAITAPVAQSTLSGQSVFAADAAALDGRTITQVDFWVDGALVATLNSSPFAFSWNSRTVTNGAHLVTARAMDSASFTSTTPATAFNTANDFTPPQVAVTNPVASAVTRGQVSLSADASDDQGVAQVEFFIDGAWVGSSSAPPFVFTWNSSTATNGNHTVLARATDAATNATDSQLVTYSVDNQVPVTSVTAPAAGGWVVGQVTITASASDNASIQRVEFYDGANLISTDFASPYQATWQTAGLSGAHALTSKAFDVAGNQATSAAVTVNILVAQVATWNAALKAPKCSTLGISCDTGTLVVGRGPLGPEPSQPNTINTTCADGTSGTFHGSGESLDRLMIATVAGGALTPGAQVRVTATVWAKSNSDRLDIWRAPNASSPSWVLVATLTPTVFNAASTLQTTFTLPSGPLQAVRGSLRRNGSAVVCPSGTSNDRDDLIFVTQ